MRRDETPAESAHNKKMLGRIEILSRYANFRLVDRVFLVLLWL